MAERASNRRFGWSTASRRTTSWQGTAVVKELNPAKVRAARAAADLVESGMVVGLGTGSTAALMVQRLGERVEQDGLKIIGVPTSVATAELARRCESRSASSTMSAAWT